MKSLLASSLCGLLLLAGPALAAAPAVAGSATAVAASASADAGAAAQPRRALRRAVWAAQIAADPSRAAIVDLIALERAYRQRQDMPAVLQLYTDTSARTDNPTIRNFCQRRLARLQWQGGQQDAAISTLQQNLERNLQALPAH